jgi:preprotein translocase subunit SecF
MHILKYKFWYFAFSLLLIVPGLVSLYLWGLQLGIDFTGGTLTEVRFEKQVDKATVAQELTAAGFPATVQETSNNSYILRTKPLSDEEAKKLQSTLNDKEGKAELLRVETVGPTVGAELLKNAIIGLVVASVAIVLYIAFSFRKVPRPASSWRFGITAVITLLHDALLVVGIFSLLGHFLHVEVDSLFMTALLTIIGFSVHDTIVVFDRIRENLLKINEPFEEVANVSLNQTIGRSLNTSVTVILVLVALLIFGSTATYWFTVALLIGIVAGTYSSIFNATPLLVVWQNWSDKRRLAKK